MTTFELDLDVVWRLLAAAALGAAVGFEREASDQPAGLRTHLTVSLGAALFGVVSTLGFLEYETSQRATNIQFDVTRVASQVVSALGFIGAGVIFRRGTTVHNLTTAASLWAVAAVGLACGVGDLGPATIGTVVLLVALVLLRLPRDWIKRRLARDDEPVRIVVEREGDADEVIDALRALPGVHVGNVGLQKEDGRVVISADVEVEPKHSIHEVLSPIARRGDVQTFAIG